MNRSEENSESSNSLDLVRELVQSCIQCGTCTGSCPNSFAMDFTPRILWRKVIMGEKEEIFASKTFALCSSCYTCTLRCPRDLPLTEAMGRLKQIAFSEKTLSVKSSVLFYKYFLESVRKHGRVNETEFMTYFFLAMKNPLLPLRYTSPGLKMLKKGKISIFFPLRNENKLDALFQKIEELEKSI